MVSSSVLGFPRIGLFFSVRFSMLGVYAWWLQAQIVK